MSSLLERSTILLVTLSVAFFAAATEAAAQFDASNPKRVGVVILPIEVEYAEDRGLAADMERVLGAGLAGRIGHPVYTGSQVRPALEDGVKGCLVDRFCIPFMGDQFNVSLVLHVRFQKTGEEVTLEVDFYATGNGLRMSSQRVTLAVGDRSALLGSFIGWIKELFAASLLVNAESLAGTQGVIGSTGKKEEQLARDLASTRRKTTSSRREDFGSLREAEVGFDRSDPSADLRKFSEGGEGTFEDRWEEQSQKPAPRPQSGRREPAQGVEEPPDYEQDLDLDLDLDQLEEQSAPPQRSSEPSRRQANKAKDSLSLDARQTSGASVRSYGEAQRAGFGPREYQRFTRSGLTMEAFQERRWAHGRRFHLRLGGYYGLGWLTRRYATIIYIPATGQKSEEYAWESLGFSAVNPGLSLGLGYAPLDFMEIEFEFSLMMAQQDLRNEYIWQGAEVPTNKGAPPRSQRTAHVLTDLRLRFFPRPMARVKFSPGIGVTVAVMGGYQIDDQGPLQYSARPVAGLVGLTPLVGITAAISPFVSLYVDLLPTIILSRGAAEFEELQFFNGETERIGLQDADLNPPLRGCGGSEGAGFSSCPLLFRAGVGTMVMF
ncbi:MAG: hypothetical protein CMP23_05370 [Rickettsiales bacterium]|nr:hypothetical protein [Rickettsiales bacterium]